MREFKFRVWDNHMKQMIYIPVNAIISLNLSNLMQYTGLKDTNEKEIYEGDILRTNFGDIVEVVFDYGCFFIQGKDLDVESVGLCEWQDYMSEIIGNIYENPELLGDHNE